MDMNNCSFDTSGQCVPNNGCSCLVCLKELNSPEDGVRESFWSMVYSSAWDRVQIGSQSHCSGPLSEHFMVEYLSRIPTSSIKYKALFTLLSTISLIKLGF
jgi:hypothetical protein